MNEINEARLNQAIALVHATIEHQTVSASEIPGLISSIYESLVAFDAEPEPEKPEPAIEPAESVTDDYIICLEDGKKFKTLKRHIMSVYNMTPEEYRAKWGLPADYPMVAPSYTAKRSRIAKNLGLGKKAVAPTKKVKKTAAPKKENETVAA